MNSRNFRSRLTNSMAVILAVMAGILYGYRGFFLGPELGDTSLGSLAPLMILMMAFAVFILNYLKTGSFLGTEDTVSTSDLMREEFSLLRKEIEKQKETAHYHEQLQSELQDLRNKVLNRSHESEVLSDDEKAELVANIKDNIVNDSSNELLNHLEERLQSEVKREYLLSNIRQQCEQVRQRLESEISALGRRGNLNLVIGVFTTIAAVTILATTVLDSAQKLDGNDLVAYYTPRLTLSIFIEIFSFFFLKLYKTGLSEIKYFQNELTNVELKFIALEKAYVIDNEESIKHVIKELMLTERNFKISKGESTVDLEKHKVDQAGNQKLLDSLVGLLSAK
ncbi:TPA: hypothetical protein I7776_21585, partial [Vibrio vulnificus]|nr:hypothetical protein [Vibrio vulnificus]